MARPHPCVGWDRPANGVRLRTPVHGLGERICADTTVTNPADPRHERAEPRLPGLGDRVDKPQRGLHVTVFGEGDSRGFVSRSGENRVRTCVEHGAETRGYTSPSRAPWFRAEGAVRHWGRPRAPRRLDR